MQFGEIIVRKCLTTPKGLNVKILFNPFRVVKKIYIFHSELHSGLSTFNPFGIVSVLFKSQLGIIIEPNVFQKKDPPQYFSIKIIRKYHF